MITSFIPVFEERLQKLKNTLKSELQRAKSERRKDVMKRLVKDSKSLQKTINEVKKENITMLHFFTVDYAVSVENHVLPK